VKLFATWLALVVLAVSAASAAAAEPRPDAAPQGPAVAPDPAPGAAQDTPEPAEQWPPAPPAQTQPRAPAPAQQPSASEPREKTARPAGEHRHISTKPHRADAGADAARPSSIMRIRALLPGDQTTAESSSKFFILAAGALLALVLASGSLVSIASRAMKGQLR
jgi:hypothetical protein